MEKKRNSLPLAELAQPPERVCERRLPRLVEDILEDMSIPQSLMDIAGEATPQRSEESGQWFLDYKGWRVIFGVEPSPHYKNDWVKAIDQGYIIASEWNGSKHVEVKVGLEHAALLNEAGRSLCECGKFGICLPVRLVRRS